MTDNEKHEYQSLASEDLRRVILNTPSDVQELLMGGDVFLAGGFIRSVIGNEAPSDIDLFGSDGKCVEERAKKLSKSRGAKLHQSDNAHTVVSVGRTPVQFIHRWLFDDPSKLLSHFDFTIARAVIWWDAASDQWSSLCDGWFYKDLAAKRLKYCAPMRDDGNGATLLRVRKFLQRGYCISAHDLGSAIAGLCREIEFDECHDKDNIKKAIIRKLVEVDPLHVVDGTEIAGGRESVPISKESR
jgi:hypothetical protein